MGDLDFSKRCVIDGGAAMGEGRLVGSARRGCNDQSRA